MCGLKGRTGDAGRTRMSKTITREAWSVCGLKGRTGDALIRIFTFRAKCSCTVVQMYTHVPVFLRI